MNVRDFQLPEVNGLQPPNVKNTPRKLHNLSGPFLRGPVPWSWLHAAIELGGPALQTGLGLWHFWYLNKQKPYQVSNKVLAATTKLSARSIQRGVLLLESRGLINVCRKPGARSEMTIFTPDFHEEA